MPTGLPSSMTVEVQFNGVAWTAVTSYVRAWKIEQGSDSGPQPGVLTLELDNSDGTWTPENPLSTFYPNVAEGKAIRVTMVKGVTSTRFYGWLSNIEPTYPDDPTLSMAIVTAVDLLGVWQRTKLKPYPLQSGAVHGYYPLTEKSARGGFTNTTSSTLPDLYVYQSATTGSADAAADDSFSTDTDPCLSLTSGRGLRFRNQPTLSTGLSDQFWFAGLLLLTASAGTLYSDGNISVTWDGLGTVTLTHPITGTATVTGVSVDAWHMIRVARFNTSLTVQVDGTTSSALASSTGAPRIITIAGNLTVSVRDLAFVYTQLSGVSGSGQAIAAAPYLTALGVGTTLATLATDLGFAWTSAPIVNATATAVGGLSKFEAVKRAADSQSGRMWCAYTSTSATVTVENDADQKPITVALTIDAELDMLGAPTITRGLSGRVDTVTVHTPIGDTTVTAGTAGNFGATSLDIDAFLKDAGDQYAKATAPIGESDALVARLSSITVDLVGSVNDLYASWFAVTIGERVRLSNLPSTYFGRTYMDGYVEGWVERWESGSYTVELFTSPADAPSEALVEDATYGRVCFGDGVATLTSTITSSATSLSITWTGSQTLSTAAGDYPLDLDLNGERVTIASAPAGSTSPQTVTVTRGVAPTVARAHNAGEPIEVWFGARVAL